MKGKDWEVSRSEDGGLGDITSGGREVTWRATSPDPRDSSPPGSPVPGILQARTLEWVAISFSNTEK